MSLPTDSAARKRIPMFSGLLAYFPDALATVAQLSFDGNEKHNPGEPLHWSREKSSDHLDCCVRHLTDIATGADKIEELKALAWRALAELQLTLEAQQCKDKCNWSPRHELYGSPWFCSTHGILDDTSDAWRRPCILSKSGEPKSG